jgi:hypothetical protein
MLKGNVPRYREIESRAKQKHLATRYNRTIAGSLQ